MHLQLQKKNDTTRTHLKHFENNDEAKTNSLKNTGSTYESIIQFGEVRGCVGVGEANPNRRLQEEQVGLWQEQ